MGTSERKTLEPIGSETTKDYNLPYLEVLEISVGDIQILPGDPKIEITCAENIREKIKTGFEEGKFYIHTKDNIKDKLTFDVKVFTNELDEIYLYDQASLVNNDATLKTDSLQIKTFNASKVNMNLEVDYLRAVASNATVMNLKGKANYLDANAKNAGRIEAKGLEAKEVNVYASNAGALFIHAIEKLSASINNGARVNYLGQPQIMRNSVSSGGSLNSISEAD